jgi:predicted anti-sigma-YlaC factor YlaD
MRDMPCVELVELVTDYLEGALGPADRRRFEAHLGQCEGCRAYFDQLRRTIGAIGRLAPEALPETMRTELLEAFRDRRAA